METRRTVRKGLDLLKPYLRSFVEQRLRTVYGPGYAAKERRLKNDQHPDVQALLSIVLEHWMSAFSQVLTPADRSLVFEIKDARNAWAHEKPLSLDEAYRTLDSIERLLGSLGVSTELARIEALKHEIRLRQVGVGSPARNDAASASSTSGPRTAPPRKLGRKGAELRGKTLRIAPRVLKEGNPRQPYTHGWLAFEVLKRAEGGRLSFEEYSRRLFNPDPKIAELAKAIPGVPNSYQDLRHVRHDIAHGRIYVE